MSRDNDKKPCEPAMKLEGLPWDNAMRALLNAQPPNAEAIENPPAKTQEQTVEKSCKGTCGSGSCKPCTPSDKID